jgi:predicted amidophosphoribosyltransferase
VRTRPTVPQSGSSLRARRRNVADSFVASGPVGERVLLLDDVSTSGATLAAAALALREAGARRVIPLALAGTPPPVL